MKGKRHQSKILQQTLTGTVLQSSIPRKIPGIKNPVFNAEQRAVRLNKESTPLKRK